MRSFFWLAAALLLPAFAHAQDQERIQPAGNVRTSIPSVSAGLAHEVAATARDFARFRDPEWSLLTIAQIGAASADAATSLNNFHACPSCTETGVPRFIVGARPDAHKYIIAGLFEIGIEAVAAHYFRTHSRGRKWYWRMIWSTPQSLSLYLHADASRHNAAQKLP